MEAEALSLLVGAVLDQITLMDANYVMDEKLGSASYNISKMLKTGHTETVPFLIGKVRPLYLHCLSVEYSERKRVPERH